MARVSTEALELSSTPPPPGFDLRREIARLTALREKLAGCGTTEEKLRAVNSDSRVRRFFSSHRGLVRVLALGSEELFLLKCLVAAGQEHVLCLGDGGQLESSPASEGSVKSAFYALAEMIEKLDSRNGNGGVGFGNMGMALEDHEIRDLNKLLETLAQIERFYDCIGGIIGSVLQFLLFFIFTV